MCNTRGDGWWNAVACRLTPRHATGLGTPGEGLRIGEAIAADVADLDTDAGLLAVHHAKFGKHRLVPLHPSTLRTLAGYADLREAAHPHPASPALFISTAGTRLHQSNVNVTFTRLTEQAGLTPRPGSCRPRIHDCADMCVVPTRAGASQVRGRPGRCVLA